MISILGDGLDVLVAASELSKKGIEVHLEASPERLGGHFKGYTANCGTLVDAGMVLLERDVRDTTQLGLESYRGLTGAAIRPFISEIFAWLNVNLERQKIWSNLNGIQLPDFFISDELEFLNTLTKAESNLVENELSSILDSTNPHPRDKNRDPRFQSMHILDALRNSIGASLTEKLFLRWINTYDSSNKVKAIDHRLLWLPLYWPETVFNALKGQAFPNQIHFLRPKDGPLALYVRRLSSTLGNTESPRLKQTPGLTVDMNKPNQPSSKVAKRPLDLVHFCVKKDLSETEFLADIPFGISRVHFSLGSRTKLVGVVQPVISIEIPKIEQGNLDSLKSATIFMDHRGIERLCDGHVISTALPLEGMHFEAKTKFDVLSSSFGEHGASFNDHVARGLATARALIERIES